MATTVPMFVELDQEERERELLLEQEESISRPETDVKLAAEGQWNRLGKRTLLAAEKGRLFELIYCLREDSRLINFSDTDGYTPLHRACYGGHKDCVKYLIKHGANVESKTNEDWTPLHCAVRWNNIEVAEILIQNGANINAKSSGNNTPLHIVASNGRYSITCDIIQMLLYHPDCDYTVKNTSGDTAYSIAKRSGPFYRLWVGVMTLYPETLDVVEDD